MFVLTLKTSAVLPIRQLRLWIPLRTINLIILTTTKNTEVCHMWIIGDREETPCPFCTTCTLQSASWEPLCFLWCMTKTIIWVKNFGRFQSAAVVLYLHNQERKKALNKPCQLPPPPPPPHTHTIKMIIYIGITQIHTESFEKPSRRTASICVLVTAKQCKDAKLNETQGINQNKISNQQGKKIANK